MLVLSPFVCPHVQIHTTKIDVSVSILIKSSTPETVTTFSFPFSIARTSTSSVTQTALKTDNLSYANHRTTKKKNVVKGNITYEGLFRNSTKPELALRFLCPSLASSCAKFCTASENSTVCKTKSVLSLQGFTLRIFSHTNIYNQAHTLYLARRLNTNSSETFQQNQCPGFIYAIRKEDESMKKVYFPVLFTGYMC
jgi:hypothetical protein